MGANGGKLQALRSANLAANLMLGFAVLNDKSIHSV